MAVHPVALHHVLDLVDAAGWQIRQDDDDGLTVLLAAPRAGIDPARLQPEVSATLATVGAAPAIRVEFVDTIPAGAAGKRPLVIARHRAPGEGPVVRS